MVAALSSAATTYGTDILAQGEHAAADASVTLARRLWARISQHSDVTDAVNAVAAHPNDDDYELVLKSKVEKAIAREPRLVEDLARLLGTTVTASGDRSIAAQVNRGILSTGDKATNTQFGA